LKQGEFKDVMSQVLIFEVKADRFGVRLEELVDGVDDEVEIEFLDYFRLFLQDL